MVGRTVYALCLWRAGDRTRQLLSLRDGFLLDRGQARHGNAPDNTEPAPDFNYPPGSDPAGTKTESQANAIAYGAAAGLGVEVSILPNMFLRAEWEYVQFAPIHDIQVNINSGRVGLGLKF